jgi:hypothetical protein
VPCLILQCKFFFFILIFLLLCWVGVYYGIYKSSYNVLNISYLNSPPPPFSFIPPSVHSWNSFTRYHFSSTYMCTLYISCKFLIYTKWLFFFWLTRQHTSGTALFWFPLFYFVLFSSNQRTHILGHAQNWMRSTATFQ